jgi:hypothetical protein
MTRRTQRPVAGNRRHPGGRGPRLLEVKVRKVTARRERRQKISTFFWTTALVVTLAVVGWLGVETALDKFFFSNPEYTLRKVTLELDGIMSRDEALEETGIREGENIFRTDLAAAEKSLRAIPQVASVVIERHLPDHIAISLTARKPVAWVSSSENDSDPFDPSSALLADASGFLMKPRVVQPDFHRLPVIYGVRGDSIRDGEPLHSDDLRNALALLREVESRPDCLLGIRSLNIAKGYCVEVVSDKNARITFLAEDFPSQLARLRQLLEHCRDSGRELESVNLMVRRNTPVTFAPAARTQTAQAAGHIQEKGD